MYESARKLSRRGIVIEIGSWKGRSTICFGSGSKDGQGATTYSIDPHTGSSEHIRQFGKVDTYDEFLKNIKVTEVHKYIVPVRKTSEEASKNFDKKVDFILVDGAHEYVYVNKDYKLWFPKLKNGGIIAFHDCYQALGVHLLTALILVTSSKVKDPKLVDTLTIIKKIERNSLTDRFNNILFVLYRLLFGWIGVLKIDYFGTIE